MLIDPSAPAAPQHPARARKNLLGTAIALVMLSGCASGSASSPVVPLNSFQSIAIQSVASSETDATGDALACHGRNLIQDGGFETPVLPPAGGQVFPAGSALGPWIVIGPAGDSVALLNATYMAQTYTINPQAGSQSIDLTVEPNGPAGLQQTVNLEKGHRYTLCFSVGNINDPAELLGKKSTDIVRVNGHKVFTARNARGVVGSGTVVWKTFRTTIVGSGGPTKISFNNGDKVSDNYNGLDSVELVP